MIGKIIKRSLKTYWCGNCGKKALFLEWKGWNTLGNVWSCENCKKHYFGLTAKEIKNVINER